MNIEDAIEILKNSKKLYLKEKIDSDILEEAIESLLTAYEKEKERNIELTNSYNQAIKETNEENKRCMLLAVENQDLKEMIKNSISKDKVKELKQLVHKTLDDNGVTRGFQLLIDDYFDGVLGE